jgi:hypothetical protein
MLAALVFAGLSAQTRAFDFLGFGPYDKSVPVPSAVLGYGAGERHTTFLDQERVLAAIESSASGRMRIVEYGHSTEGRRLRVAVFGNAENLARLDAIKADLATIAQGKADSDTIKRTPVIIWINECIHGDETASFESGLYLIYTLAASQSPEVKKALQDAIVVVNPSYNPDGHERFVVWYNSIAVGSPRPFAFEQSQPDVMGGRTNHYRFDMNRDRIAMSQKESQQESAAVLSFHPQVYADQHGEVDSYFFPPCPMSININVGRERYAKWTEIFGRANAEAFDQNGWLYFIGKEFDLYYAGYLDSWNTLTGAIGMTHETNGGSRLALDRDAGGTVTLRDGMMKHFTTALTLIKTSAARREEILQEYARYKSDAVSGKSAGGFRRVIVTSDDPRPLARLETQLSRGGIHTGYASKAFKQRAKNYWTGKDEEHEFPAGSLVVDMAQEQGPVAKAMLEPGSDFEAAFVKRQQDLQKARQDKERYPGLPRPEFYDMTGWCLIYAHNLDGWYSTETPQIDTMPSLPARRESSSYGRVGAALRYTSQDDILAIFDLLAAGVHVDATSEAMTLAGKEYPAGTFLVLREHNDGIEVENALRTSKRTVSWEPLSTGYPEKGATGPGSEGNRSIKEPKIGIVFGAGGGTTDFGGIWFTMEQTLGIPFTPVTSETLDSPDDFTCIVCPSGGYGPPSDKLKDWVRGGGCLVLLEGANWALGEKGFGAYEYKRAVASLPGSLFRASLNPRSVFSWGYDTSHPISVPVGGGTFPKTKPEGGAVVSFSSDEKAKKLLSGWLWDDTESSLAGTTWMQDQPFGRGHVVIFLQDPTERAMWPGLNKLLLNALLLGAN